MNWIEAGKYHHFPRHNGHEAWTHFSPTIDGAMLEDLIQRIAQNDRIFVQNCARFLFRANVSPLNDGTIMCDSGNPDSRLSLRDNSCGAYTTDRGLNSFSLRGVVREPYHDDARDIAHIAQLSSSYGFTPLLLFCTRLGWLPENYTQNLINYGLWDKKYRPSDRLRYSIKACHSPVLIEVDELDNLLTFCRSSFPIKYGYSLFGVYPYYSENGRITCVRVIYWKKGFPNCSLLFSKWVSANGVAVYDSLNWPYPKLPYCALGPIDRSRNLDLVVICHDETAVHFVNRNYLYNSNRSMVVSYIDINDTNWNCLPSSNVYILPACSRYGFQEAIRLHLHLNKLGFNLKFISNYHVQYAIEADPSAMVAANDSYEGVLSLPQFAQLAKSTYNIEPPRGILPSAELISSCSEEADSFPEILIPGLLQVGDIMMIHAYRGAGKSFLALLWAISFTLGKAVLNGKIDPKRKYRVLLLDAEMKKRTIKLRAERIYMGLGEELNASNSFKIIAFNCSEIGSNFEDITNLENLKVDFEDADIIIVDGVFKFFPSVMSSAYADVEGFIRAIDFFRKMEKNGNFN